jgi:plastocyanin
MYTWRNYRAALLAATLFSSGLMAATHDVAVNNNFFSPNDLSIQVGDTVRWTNPTGSPSHDVTADDASFASVTAPSFVFEHTFNSVGEVLYYCTVHSMPGRDRNLFMNGRIVVEDAAPEPTFTINAGLNDSWFNPATAGQGFFITVFPDLQKMFLAWFTYETERPPPDVTAMLGEPGHRWITAFGPYDGDTANLDIEITQGGVFDSPAPAPTQGPGGTIIVTFTGCNAGEVMYDIPSIMRSGTVPIERIALDNVPACEAELAVP